MSETSFSSIGLLLAGATSTSNVIKDVTVKQVVGKHDLVASTFLIRFVALLVLGGCLASRLLWGDVIVLRETGPLFGIEGSHLSAGITFFVYLTIDVVLVSISTLLYYRALQVSPISLVVPFLAFTPIFLVPTGFLLLGELPSSGKLLGIVLIFIGSIVIHRDLFAIGPLEPIKAIYRERGTRYALIVSFILSITNPIEKKLVQMSDALTQATAYSVGLVGFFLILALARRADIRAVATTSAKWVGVAGALEAMTLLLQLASHNFIDVVVTISVKRAGIVLAVLLGWLIFRERNVGDKLIASMVMVAGVAILYLPLPFEASVEILVGAIIAMSIALYATRARATRQPVDPIVPATLIE